MAEQTSSDQATAADRETVKARRTGQTCITVFVVFVISLFAFGKAPFVSVSGDKGSKINFDLISCLGVAMGVFALLFTLTNFTRVLRLPTLKKVLGLVGVFGLIAHTVFALFLPLSYGATRTPPAGTAGNPPFDQRGPEEWTVDGRTCKIANTYYLRLPQGLQFTIEYPYQFGDRDARMNDKRALAIVFPLMRHAYVNGLYKRTSVTKIGQGTLHTSRIGVVLVERGGGVAQGYRVALSLDEIARRIATASTSSATSPSDAGDRP